MRKTKIICTLGPASESEEKIVELMQAGMNVARFNFSHGTHEEQKGKHERLQNMAKKHGYPIATMLDTKGPEIRLKDFAEGKVQLVEGQKFTFTTEDIMGTAERASITYKNLKNDVQVGGSILIDDGLIGLRIDEITDTDIICTVLNGGPISNHKGVNVPGATLSMPFISEADLRDITFGAKSGFDFVAASFTRNAQDVKEVRKILEENNSKAKIIAKIENMQGIHNLDEIIAAADGVMVARGDMGVEIPMEDVPVFQKEIIKKAVNAGKFVITATQMLDSMMKNPRPTRAEITDVANAIYDGTSAIMLSGETANGKYPVEAVQTMVRIAERTENDIDYVQRLKKRDVAVGVDITTAISHSTCTTAMDLKVAAIITVTMSGFTAAMISRYKPNCPIIGCTTNKKVCRQLNMEWGVYPVLMEEEETEEALFTEAVKAAEKTGIIKKGDIVVLTAGMPLGISGKTNMLRVIEI